MVRLFDAIFFADILRNGMFWTAELREDRKVQ